MIFVFDCCLLSYTKHTMALRISNVRGDGNCYYRCIWNIVKHSEDFCSDLGLTGGLKEDDAVKVLRRFVANKLAEDDTAQTMLRNVWELSSCIADIAEQYPLAMKIARFKKWETVLTNACKLIASTNIMASELEHTIIASCLPNIHIVILTRFESDTLADMAEKWLYDLNILLPKIEKAHVALLVNEDYIHYKYMRFNKNTTPTTLNLGKYIDECLESDGEEDEDDE